PRDARGLDADGRGSLQPAAWRATNLCAQEDYAARAHGSAPAPLPCDARQCPRFRPPHRDRSGDRNRGGRRLDHLAAALPGHLHGAPGQAGFPHRTRGRWDSAQAHPDTAWRREGLRAAVRFDGGPAQALDLLGRDPTDILNAWAAMRVVCETPEIEG